MEVFRPHFSINFCYFLPGCDCFLFLPSSGRAGQETDGPRQPEAQGAGTGGPWVRGLGGYEPHGNYLRTAKFAELTSEPQRRNSESRTSGSEPQEIPLVSYFLLFVWHLIKLYKPKIIIT